MNFIVTCHDLGLLCCVYEKNYAVNLLIIVYVCTARVKTLSCLMVY